MSSIYSSNSSDLPSDYNFVDNFSSSFSLSSSSSLSSLSSLSSINNSFSGRNGFTWTDVPPHSASFRLSNNVTVQSGLTHAVCNFSQIDQFFNYFIDSIFIDHTIRCINRRLSPAEQPITREEFSGFMGVLIYIGLRQSNTVELSEIWSPKSIFFLEPVALTMSRDRFYCILHNLCFYEQSGRVERFEKVRFVFEYFRSKITSAYEPGSNLCVDEILYSFRGNCKWRQYMPSKPAKYGQKYWCLADVYTSYLCNFDVYLGRDPTRNVPVGESVVLKLAEGFLNTGQNITMDNFFTSIPLAQKLFEKKTTIVGTMKSNKPQVPSCIKPDRSRAINSSLFLFHDYLTLASFVPKRSRAVNILSTQHHSPTIEANQKPAIIGCYNDTKGAVDTVAHLFSMNSCRRKTKKWTTNTFYFILDAAVHNACVLYTLKNGLSARNRRAYIESLAKSLCSSAAINRCADWHSNNATGIPSSIVQAAISQGIYERPAPTPSINTDQISRCYLCPKAKTSRNTCIRCRKFVCKTHSVERKVLCRSCSLNF